MRKLLKFIKDFYDFTPSQSRGFIVFIMLLLIAWGSIFCYQHFTKPQIQFSSTKLDSLLFVHTAKTPETTFYQKKKPTIKRSFQAKHEKKIVTPVVISINTADTTAFKQIRGIGSAYSKRIVKFRDGLHTFHSIAQLNEVFGLQDFDFQTSNVKIELDSLHQPWIDINTMDYNTLRSHPYINSKQAGQIVNYREKVKPFEHKTDLLKIYSIDSTHYQKIEPYLLELGKTQNND